MNCFVCNGEMILIIDNSITKQYHCKKCGRLQELFKNREDISYLKKDPSFNE